MQPSGEARGSSGLSRQALDSYLAEVANEGIMSAAEEVQRARKIATLRTTCWQAILSYPSYVDPIVRFIRAQFETIEAESTERLLAHARAVRDRRSRANGVGYAHAIEVVAGELAGAEPEPATADLVRSELARVAERRLIGAKIPFRAPPPSSRPFAEYLGRVEDAATNYARARQGFVRANLRLVIASAKRYNHGILSLSDLIQEGNIGLMKAVDRYDPDRGTRFSTFAVWWIRHKITRAMANHGRLIRLPVHVTVDHMNLRKADAKLRRRLGRDPTEEELAVVVRMSVERVTLTRRAIQTRPISTATPLLADGAACIHDLLRCESTEDEFEHIEVGRDCERLEGAMSALPVMERDILRRRFGLGDGEEHTLAEIGEVYHLSRERIRQLQNRALRRLRGQFEAAAPAA